MAKFFAKGSSIYIAGSLSEHAVNVWYTEGLIEKAPRRNNMFVGPLYNLPRMLELVPDITDEKIKNMLLAIYIDKIFEECKKEYKKACKVWSEYVNNPNNNELKKEFENQMSNISFLSYFILECFFAFGDHGSSQVKGQIGTVAASLCHSHSKARSEQHLQPTP